MVEENNGITPEPIMKIITGAWLTQTLYVAADLGIFTKIAEGKNTIEKVANDLNIEKRPAEMLLNACVALDLLVKNGEEYENTPVADKFLIKNKPTYYGDMVAIFGMSESDEWNSWVNLKEAILTNSPVTSGLSKRMEDIEKAKRFTKAMHNNAMGPAIVLSKKFDFSKFTKLLDLGGGSGAFPIILTKEYPNLIATVFELPNVCSVAKDFIEKANAESKVSTIVGDFVKDEFPRDYDIVLLSQIIHSFSAEENKRLLKKVYDYLPSNGVIIINEFLLNEEKTGPLFPALFALNMLAATEGGDTYTEKEVKGWLEEAGFENLETIKLAGPISSIIAKK